MARKSVTADELNNILNERLVNLERNLIESITRSVTESIGQLWGERIVQNEKDIEQNAASITALANRVAVLENTPANEETIKKTVVRN